MCGAGRPLGRGKSTLMKCLYGSYAVNQGALWLQRADVSGWTWPPPHRRPAAMRRRDIAYASSARALPRQAALDVVAERKLLAPPGAGD